MPSLCVRLQDIVGRHVRAPGALDLSRGVDPDPIAKPGEHEGFIECQPPLHLKINVC